MWSLVRSFFVILTLPAYGKSITMHDAQRIQKSQNTTLSPPTQGPQYLSERLQYRDEVSQRVSFTSIE
ncbi:hypothetical protein J6590_106247 [Homalodisca vitripennis]|nr:hypothetical protein J6590_106247 [Homalodisca vitripennis]